MLPKGVSEDLGIGDVLLEGISERRCRGMMTRRAPKVLCICRDAKAQCPESETLHQLSLAEPMTETDSLHPALEELRWCIGYVGM